MIRIVCTSSPVTMLPIRALLQLLSFNPRNNRELAAYVVVYPFSAYYRKALRALSYVECVPEAQFLGIVSQWRVKRWFSWLARSIAPLIGERQVFFYHAELLDEASQLFLQILSREVGHGVVNLVLGQPAPGGAFVADHTNCLTSEEQSILSLLMARPSEVTQEQAAVLEEAGTGCILSANYWQVEKVYNQLVYAQTARSHYVLGLSMRFFGSSSSAEWHYLQSLEAATDPLVRVHLYYALAILYLRTHAPVWRDTKAAGQYLEAGYEVLDANDLSQEAHVFARAMLDAGRSFYEFRLGNFEESLAISTHSLEVLESLPDSLRKGCCIAHNSGNKAEVLRKLGRLDEACEVNAFLVEYDSQQPIWWVEYIKCLLELQRFDRACEVLAQALNLHHDYADLHALQGHYLRKIGQHKQSTKSFVRAARYAPDNRGHEREIARSKERGKVAEVAL